MTTVFKGLFRWSLEITGVSIIWYNYQPYERQQKIIGVYNFLKNSYRFTRCLYYLKSDFKTYQQNVNAQSLKLFKLATAKRLQQLCEQNLGVYARMAQVVAGYTDIVPEQYRNQFNKLNDKQLESVPYTDIKTALTTIFKKDMKELFDGFQIKPLKTGLFTQTHRVVLMENYRQAVVKVLLPSLQIQAEHDIWFINKIKDYATVYLQKNNFKKQSYEILTEVLKDAEEVIRSQINLELQLSNADKNKELMYERNSSLYIPYYFSKLCNKNVIIRQYVQGININDLKGLKQIGLKPEVAFAFVLSQIHHLMRKLHLISGSLKPSNIMIRKYVKPYKSISNELPVHTQDDKKEKVKQSKKFVLIHPQYQVVFLAQNNFQSIPTETSNDIIAYWNNLKKQDKRILPSVSSFYKRLPDYKRIKADANALNALITQKYYLYEPLLKIYESLIKK